jgi:two-component system phosphate regulon response regulator OmpR
MTSSPTTQPHILVVDDDVALRNLLQRYLVENDFAVTAVADGAMMDQALQKETPDLIILDLMLPGEDGLSLARRLRTRSNTPIIILSARGEEVDRIVGLEIGADDYLAKPFNPRELLARIRSVLRRSATSAPANDVDSNTICFGRYRLDSASRQLFQDDKPLALTSGEYALLEVFATHPNRVLNRDLIAALMCGSPVSERRSNPTLHTPFLSVPSGVRAICFHPGQRSQVTNAVSQHSLCPDRHHHRRRITALFTFLAERDCLFHAGADWQEFCR